MTKIIITQKAFNNVFEKETKLPKNKKEYMQTLYKFWKIGKEYQKNDIINAINNFF